MKIIIINDNDNKVFFFSRKRGLKHWELLIFFRGLRRLEFHSWKSQVWVEIYLWLIFVTLLVWLRVVKHVWGKRGRMMHQKCVIGWFLLGTGKWDLADVVESRFYISCVYIRIYTWVRCWHLQSGSGVAGKVSLRRTGKRLRTFLFTVAWFTRSVIF